MAETDANASSESSNMSNISDSNDVAVVPDAPVDAEEFRILCDALQRNDPNVTSISTRFPLDRIAEGYGRDLGHALQRNTVVSEIELNLNHLLAGTTDLAHYEMSKQPKLVDERTGLLLHWMEHSCSLRNVKIHSGYDRNLMEMLLELVLGALVKHQNILSFESTAQRVSLSMLTSFLQANKSLQVLKIDTNVNLVPDSDDVFEESARAVGALHQLEVLSISTRQIDPFLRHLTTPPFTVNTKLRELTLTFHALGRRSYQSGTRFEASALCQVLSYKSCRLERLELNCLYLDERHWTLLSLAMLRSNPSSLLHTLLLAGVTFSEEAARLFLRDMQSNPVPASLLRPLDEQPHAPPLHHILDLRLKTCTLETPRCALKLGNMLCGSLLQHFTLDLATLGRRQQAFFDVLSSRGTAVYLESMHLSGANYRTLRQLAPYIETTKNLRYLTVQLSNGILRDVSVPNVFLSGLRKNGSLYKVDLPLYTTSDASLLRIQAYTTRNRVLPQLMVNTSFESNANRRRGNDAAEQQPSEAASAAPSASAFPTLGTVAEHAPQMAPNNFLKAFLAASESLIPSQQCNDEYSAHETPTM